ncbi:MAG: nucleotidyl transferase AbiEii/AbiGii toxin family protein [Lachnospiraceae bacterium]|jgi:predicted nucleotidyltransferase component of viral defense system|nr:nucleotidyl transferase AbiEii/AbiGii toxin family protein [Lachnospiraceae bacterium]
MNLHEDKKLFAQIVADTTKFLGLADTGIVEKDYFVTLFLKKIVAKRSDMIFKGGTSLSKCHKCINRFSEDIDLGVETSFEKLTEGQRKKLKQDIISIIEDTGFTLENMDQIRSRRDFNRYVVDYHCAYDSSFLNPYLIVETSVFIKSFPTYIMDAASLIYDFLFSRNAYDDIEKYELLPFEVKVQSLERTFIDKVFALADYYLAKQVHQHSRHIYDLYKLYTHIKFDSDFVKLVDKVRAIRKPHPTCVSAQDGVLLHELLNKIINEDYYKADYNQVTETLLFEKLPYIEAITVIQRIRDAWPD